MLRRSILLLICFLTVAGLARAQRLPETVLPEHYVITLAPDLQAAKFSGEETIRVRVLESVSSIALNAAEIEFQSADITAGGTTQKASVSLNSKQQQATLTV